MISLYYSTDFLLSTQLPSINTQQSLMLFQLFVRSEIESIVRYLDFINLTNYHNTLLRKFLLYKKENLEYVLFISESLNFSN